VPVDTRVTGRDPPQRQSARGHAGANALAIDYLVGSGEALPFGAETFDIVVCVDVLEHIEAWEGVVSEVRRVLRPQGLFLFATINRNPLAAFVLGTIGEGMIGLLPPGTHDPMMFIRPSELRISLERSGCRRPVRRLRADAPGPRPGTDLRAMADDSRPVPRPRSQNARRPDKGVATRRPEPDLGRICVP